MNSLIDESVTTQYAILQPITEHKLNVVIRNKEPNANLAAFFRVSSFSPVTSTFLTAISKNHFTTWPGLTEKLAKRHLIGTQATTPAHQQHDAQGLHSTKLPFLLNHEEIKTRLEQLKKDAPTNQDIKTTIGQDTYTDAFQFF